MDRKEGAHGLAFAQFEQVLNCSTARGACDLWNLPHLAAEDAAGIRETQEIVVGIAHDRLRDEVRVALILPLHTHAAARLRAIGLERKSLHVALLTDRDDHLMLRDELGHLEVFDFANFDRGLARIAKLFDHAFTIGANDAEHA